MSRWYVVAVVISAVCLAAVEPVQGATAEVSEKAASPNVEAVDALLAVDAGAVAHENQSNREARQFRTFGFGRPFGGFGGGYGRPFYGGGFGRPYYGGYGRPFYGGGFGRPFYGGYGRPFYGGYRRPFYGGGFGRPFGFFG